MDAALKISVGAGSGTEAFRAPGGGGAQAGGGGPRLARRARPAGRPGGGAVARPVACRQAAARGAPSGTGALRMPAGRAGLLAEAVTSRLSGGGCGAATAM